MVHNGDDGVDERDPREKKREKKNEREKPEKEKLRAQRDEGGQPKEPIKAKAPTKRNTPMKQNTEDERLGWGPPSLLLFQGGCLKRDSPRLGERNTQVETNGREPGEEKKKTDSERALPSPKCQGVLPFHDENLSFSFRIFPFHFS